ncbi:Vesicle transport protein USE1 [Toxocara canis]|uniref:Vesicle transport protein USE1 n=1 Tax=Toxocara canis TaxID=6265 RepID=A0A0B2VBG9_TOXCA|nr:Vesicle transport protein USE1 [Toxocara canis]
MVVVSVDEINLQRLLDRTKRLCRENLSENIWKLKAAIVELEALFSRLQDDRNLDADLLMQYGRDVHQMRILVEAQQKKTPVERLRWIELIPSAFPTSSVSSEDFMTASSEAAERLSQTGLGSISVDMLKAKNKAVYIADLRAQLLGGTHRKVSESGELDDVLRKEEEKQEQLAEELRAMAVLMKETYSTANAVIKQDNATLSRLQDTAELNKTKLEQESRRLEEHAYRSWCDFFYLLGIFIIISSFISMVLIMRIFTKKHY